MSDGRRVVTVGTPPNRLRQLIARLNRPGKPQGVEVTFTDGTMAIVDGGLRYTGWNGEVHIWTVSVHAPVTSFSVGCLPGFTGVRVRCPDEG